MHELRRFGASFAGLPISKPAEFRGTLIEPEKPDKDIFMDELCRFAGLIPIGEAQNTEKFR